MNKRFVQKNVIARFFESITQETESRIQKKNRGKLLPNKKIEFGKSEGDYFTAKFGIHSVHHQIIRLAMTGGLYFIKHKKAQSIESTQGTLGESNEERPLIIG